MSEILQSSKWKNKTGAYTGLTQKTAGNLYFDVGTVSTTPYTVTGLAPNANFVADNGSDALNIVGLSSHGSGGFSSLGSLIFFNRSRGSQAAPLALQSGDYIGGQVFGGYGSGDYQLSITGLISTATDDWDVNPGASDLSWFMLASNIFTTSSSNNKTTAYYDWQFNTFVGIDDGIAATPSLNFFNDTDTGFHRPGDNLIGMTVGGVSSVYIGNGATTTPYIDISPTNRTMTAAEVLVGYDPALDINFASGGMPVGFNYGVTATFSQNSFAFGAGLGFYMHPTIKNSSGSTRTIGPFLGIAAQTNYQADGGSMTVNADVPYIAQSFYTTTGGGTLSVSSAWMFYSGGYTIGAGATVGTFIDFQIAEGTNAGTLTNHIGLSIPSFTVATNNTAILIGTGTTGNWGIYQSTTTANRFGGVVQIPDGVVGTPGLAFASDTNTGIWSAGADIMAFSTAGTERARFTSGGNFIPGADNTYTNGNALARWSQTISMIFRGANQTAATPTYSWNNSTDSGFYLIADDNFGLSTQGTLRIDYSTTAQNFAEAYNMSFGTTTGTKIGTSATQKIGFWNATPVVQDTGWSVTNETTDKSFDANATTIDELADVLGTLIETLKSYGILGA